MKRRHAIQSLLGVPAAAAMPIPAPAQQAAAEETPRIQTTGADAVADPAPAFFSAQQLAALRKLAEIIAPSGAAPGAKEAQAAEFLDFLIARSPSDGQNLYRNGLDKLNSEAARLYGTPFAGASAAQAESILAPLRAAWTYYGPSDPFARFLLAAKQDVLAATLNSREWSLAAARRSRGAAGMGAYWFPIE